MATLKNTISINAPVEKVFAYVDEPTNNPEWIVGLMEVHDVTGTGVGRHLHWTYKMVGLPLKGETTTKEHVPNERLVTESKGGITSIWTGIYEREGDGTKLTMEIDYTVPVPVLGKLAEHLVHRRNQRELELSMQNIKDAVEE